MASAALYVSSPDHASPTNTGIWLAKPRQWVHSQALNVLANASFSPVTGYDDVRQPPHLFLFTATSPHLSLFRHRHRHHPVSLRIQAATPCIGGGNPVHPRRQACAPQAATLCTPGGNPVHLRWASRSSSSATDVARRACCTSSTPAPPPAAAWATTPAAVSSSASSATSRQTYMYSPPVRDVHAIHALPRTPTPPVSTRAHLRPYWRPVAYGECAQHDGVPPRQPLAVRVRHSRPGHVLVRAGILYVHHGDLHVTW